MESCMMRMSKAVTALSVLMFLNFCDQGFGCYWLSSGFQASRYLAPAAGTIFMPTPTIGDSMFRTATW